MTRRNWRGFEFGLGFGLNPDNPLGHEPTAGASLLAINLASKLAPAKGKASNGQSGLNFNSSQPPQPPGPFFWGKIRAKRHSPDRGMRLAVELSGFKATGMCCNPGRCCKRSGSNMDGAWQAPDPATGESRHQAIPQSGNPTIRKAGGRASHRREISFSFGMALNTKQ